MERPEDRQTSLGAAKARFLEEAATLTPSAWIREHPDAALGGALFAGLLVGCSEESREAALRSTTGGIRLAQAFLAGIAGGPPPGKDEPKA
jgi:hypothetical protein